MQRKKNKEINDTPPLLQRTRSVLDKRTLGVKILKIQEMSLKSYTDRQIINYILCQGWAKTEQGAKKLMNKAYEQWRPVKEMEIERLRKLKIEQLKERIADVDREKAKNWPEMLTVLLRYEQEIINLYGFKNLKELGDEAKPAENIDYSKLSDSTLLEIIKAAKEVE